MNLVKYTLKTRVEYWILISTRQHNSKRSSESNAPDVHAVHMGRVELVSLGKKELILIKSSTHFIDWKIPYRTVLINFYSQ